MIKFLLMLAMMSALVFSQEESFKTAYNKAHITYLQGMGLSEAEAAKLVMLKDFANSTETRFLAEILEELVLIKAELKKD